MTKEFIQPDTDKYADMDWAGIQEATGYTDEQMGWLQRQWYAPEQTFEEVREGVQAERERRLASADEPGGLTDQIRASDSQEE